MKRISATFIFCGILAVILPGFAMATTTSALSHDGLIKTAVLKQTTQTQRKVYKKRHRVKRHTVTGKSARAQMQLRQGEKHQAEEQKVKKAQQQLKKDTTRSH